MNTPTTPDWNDPCPSPPQLAYDVLVVYAVGGPNRAARIVEVTERSMARWISGRDDLMPPACRQLLRLTAAGVYKPPA